MSASTQSKCEKLNKSTRFYLLSVQRQCASSRLLLIATVSMTPLAANEGIGLVVGDSSRQKDVLNIIQQNRVNVKR